jgi:hypothetical protein
VPRKAKKKATLKDLHKLKQFVIAEGNWQRRITNRVKLLLRRAKLPSGPTDLPPPPKPPFR